MTEAVKFLLTGGIAAISNWTSRFLFSLWFSYEISVALAFFVGMLTAFLLMRALVFQKSEKPVANQAGYFIVINLIGLALTWSVSVYLANILFPAIGLQCGSKALAHFLGILAPVFTSYFGHKYITFK